MPDASPYHAQLDLLGQLIGCRYETLETNLDPDSAETTYQLKDPRVHSVDHVQLA